jgi:hypothetical protein
MGETDGSVNETASDDGFRMPRPLRPAAGDEPPQPPSPRRIPPGIEPPSSPRRKFMEGVKRLT